MLLLDDPISHSLSTLRFCTFADIHFFFFLCFLQQQQQKSKASANPKVPYPDRHGTWGRSRTSSTSLPCDESNDEGDQYQSDTSMFIFILIIVHKVLHLNTLYAVVRVRLFVCLSVYLCIHICVFICLSVCVCVCVRQHGWKLVCHVPFVPR